MNYCLKQNTIFLWKNGFVIPNIRPVRYREVTSKWRCQSETQKSVQYAEVSGIMCPLHRGFSMRVWPLFHPFPRKVSVIRRCPLYRMSTIRRFHSNIHEKFQNIYHVDLLCIYFTQRCREFFLFTLHLPYFLDGTWYILRHYSKHLMGHFKFLLQWKTLHSTKWGPPVFFYLDTSPVLSHGLVHYVGKTHVLAVTVEIFWLFFLNILSFNFVQTPKKTLRFM